MASKRRVFSILALVLGGVLTAVWPADKTPPYFQPLWKENTSFVAPKDPVVIDLNGDKANEIIISDSKGHLTVLSGSTGDVLWSVTLKGIGLTGPAVGHFWGDGSLDVAVADNRGFVHLYNGGDGRRLQLLALKTSVALPPTVLPPDPTRDSSGTLNYHPEAKDHLVVIDEASVIRCLVFDPEPNQAGIVWEKTLDGLALAPPSVGDVDGDGHFEVVAGVAQSFQGLLYILRGSDGAPVGQTPKSYPSNIVTICSLADVNGDKCDEIFFGTKSRELYGVRYDPTSGQVSPFGVFPRSITQEPIGDPVILLGDPLPGPTVAIQGQNLVLVRPVAGSAELDQVTQAPMTSGFGLASGSAGAKPRLVFGDDLGDIYDWYVGDLKERGGLKIEKENLGLTPVLADFDGRPGAECLFCFPEKQRIRMVAFPDYPTAPNAIVWQTRGGNLWRTGWRDRRYYEALRQRYADVDARLNANLKAAEEALSSRAWVSALQSSALVLSVDPHHPLARKFHRQAWVHQNIIPLFLGGVALLALVGAALYASFLATVRRVGLKQAAERVKADQVDEAIALYLRLHRRFPTHSKTNAILANLLVEQDRLEPDYASVFEHAYADRPGDGRLLGALSECYARTGGLSPKARDVYLKSLDVSPRPAELKFLIGRSFLAERRPQEALRFLSDATAEGFQEDQVYQAMADAYLELRYHDPEILPVLERVLPLRGNDRPFLAYLCEVYLANEKSDAVALKCAQQTLALDPACDPAHMLYVQILLAHGQAEGAWRRAEALLRQQPDRRKVLRLVSRCLIALDRRDDPSVQLLEKARSYYPDDPKILAHLAHVYFQREWFDPHAASIYRHAAELCPDDERIIEAVARLAENENDKQALAGQLEKLVALGRANRSVMIRLATVYRDLGIADPRARKVYEVAVQENPDDRDFLTALGKVYIATRETSPAGAAVLGRLRRDGVDLSGLDRQLIAALDRNSDYAALIPLCDAYLASHLDDQEVRRLRAHACLATGQADRAITEYEQLAQAGRESNEVVTDLALAYAEAGRTDDRAVSQYGRALRIAPNLDALYRAIGCAHAKRGNLQDAIGQFRTALRTRKECVGPLVDQCRALLEEDSHRRPLRWFLCELLINCGRFREAIDELTLLSEQEPEEQGRICEALGHILEVDSENVYARNSRGALLSKAGRYAEARADLEVANRLQPKSPQTMATLRAVYEALLATGEDPEVSFRLGRILRDLGETDAALRSFQRSVRDYRFEADSTREMGKIFMQKNLLDLALEEFQKLPTDDDLKETIYQLGQLCEQRGDALGARTAYRLIFAADAGFRDVQTRFETLSGEVAGERTSSIDRTRILSQLSEKAKHRYKLLEEVGRGAMGIVYRAMDSELDEVVALKILPDNLSTNTDALTRFRREARSARRLSHRNIVRIHDIGEELGRKYISMEFVEGTNLKAMIRASNGLEIPRVLKYGSQILDALAYAHSIGIVHRDIKPANIMITREDEVKITDFGIAKILESTDATAEGAVVGTPLYMSPEQVRGDPVDHRADLYSVGILLYECVEGRPPFLKGDLAYSHLHLFPEPMEHGFAELNAIIMRVLEKRKEDRWPSAQAMLDALRVLKLPGS